MKNIFLIIFVLSASQIFCETTWDDKGKDLYSRKIRYRINDSIKIVIDEKSAMEYRSTTKSLKSYNINIKNSEIEGVFDIVPSGSVEENKSAQDKDEVKYTQTIMGQIKEINDGYITVSGKKSVILNNKRSIVEVNGDVAFGDIKGGMIKSSDIMNQTIRIITLIDNLSEIIGEDNVVVQADLSSDATGDAKKIRYKIDDALRKKLILEYVNKVLNVIF